MDYIWGVMILTGICYGTAAGRAEAISDAILSSAGEAVSLCITMLGTAGLWMGLMRIAKEAGLIPKLCQWMQPFIRFLFPDIPEEHPAREQIALNCAANILGLGSAATPAGLRAMEELARLEQERQKPAKNKEASNEMCTFLILNISSLQLIPVNIIAYRAQYGSANPDAIIVPGILATAVSTAAAILFCKGMDHFGKRQSEKG